KCPSLHQRKQTLAASTNRRRRLSEWEIVAAVRRTQELPSSCSRASRRILRVVCLHLASLLCARLLAPPSASECSSCARWLLLVVRGCLCSILPPSVTGVSSQSLASRGSPVSSPAAEATRGVVSCFVAFRGVVAHSPSDVDKSCLRCFLHLQHAILCLALLEEEEELARTMEGFAADFGLYGNSTSGFASSRWDWSFLSNAHVNNSAPFTRLDPNISRLWERLQQLHAHANRDTRTKGRNKRQSQKMDEMAVLLRQLVLKADADPSVDVKTVASTTKSRRRSTSKQKGMRKDTPIDVPDYSSDHLAFRHSRRKRKTSSTGTPKQIISGKNDKLTRTLFSDKDEAKDQKERTPQTNKIGPSRPATHIGERPYVDLTVQGFDPNQAEVGDKIPKHYFKFSGAKDGNDKVNNNAEVVEVGGNNKKRANDSGKDVEVGDDVKEAFEDGALVAVSNASTKRCPTSLKELLAMRILEGLAVNYAQSVKALTDFPSYCAGEAELWEVINGYGIVCHCEDCHGVEVVIIVVVMIIITILFNGGEKENYLWHSKYVFDSPLWLKANPQNSDAHFLSNNELIQSRFKCTAEGEGEESRRTA
ncbi:hypothetical protein HN51_034021, partial [Arachis hypogaea]